MRKSRTSRGTSLLRIAVTALLAATFAHPDRVVAQQNAVSGIVTDASNGQPLSGVAVGVVGTRAGTLTDASGRYTVQAPATGTLAFSRIGYQATQVAINGRATVNVQLAVSAAMLDELVVTGYQTQRRADVTAAVSSVNLESVERQSSSSVLQRLNGRVPGVTVETSGSPGARSTVRIRGVSSFQNNSPLYVIDGTPVEEQFANFLNPHDVESIQVLKDASAASIYGARANNGVVIITTKKGRRGAPQVSIDAHFGIANPVRGYDDFLIQDPLEYFQVIKQSYQNAGQSVPSSFLAIFGDPNNPSLPKYTYVHPSAIVARDQWGRPTQVNESLYAYPNALIMPASAGTNWWDAVFGTGEVRDVNLGVRGGGANERYAVGVNFYDQVGTAAFNRYQRGTVRVNTDFNVGRLTFGENLTVALEEAYGGQAADFFGEGGIIGKNILSQPIVPIRDIQGNYASGKSPGLGNNTNPLKAAEAAKDNRNRNQRIFGNVFGRFAFTDALNLNSSIGLNAGEGGTAGFNAITPENSEPNFTNSIFENSNRFSSVTFTNTLNFVESFGGRHNVNVVVGQEAIRNRNRFIQGSMSNLVSEDINARYIDAALGDPSTRNVFSNGNISSLLSFFGKADYNFGERYYLSGTIRRDGSSRLGQANQWGTFPAFSAGWRFSEEGFMQNQSFFTNAMLRFGWGITGNQNIAAGRTIDFFGGSTGSSFYDISGADSRVVTGYRQTAIGNPNLKWEENQSTNLGLDLEFFGGNATMELDVYERNSNNLLFNPPLPGTAGMAEVPIVNIGQMQNRGIDGALGFRGTIGEGLGWNIDLNASHYRNEIIRIDGERTEFLGPIGTRNSPSVTINRLGYAVGSFYGFVNEGIYQSQAEVDQLNQNARQKAGNNSVVYQTGARPGRLRFKDVDGDGRVTAADRTVMGSPHPDLTAGLNMGVNFRNFDLAADFFGTFGNEIYDVQKEFYVFRLFNTNVRQDLVENSAKVVNGVVTNPNAKYPALDVTDAFSTAPSSFYVEDGSFVRLRSLQLGYTVPNGRFGGFQNVRVYLRGENLFTLTGYDGLDPSLPALNASRAGMDVTDQARGIDRGTYPTNRTLSIGFGLGF